MTDRTLPEENHLGLEQAYPSQPFGGEGFPTGDLREGLTKRELFAAMAMQGFAMSQVYDYAENAAKEAVEWADALLKELAK